MQQHVIGSTGSASAEERALLDLYQAHTRDLYAYVLRLVGGDAYRAEDVVQEALLRCWVKRNLYDTATMNVRRWLFRVACNLVIDEYRARSLRPREISSTATWLKDVDSNCREIERMLTALDLHEALEDLAPLHREALRATYLDELSVQQAATALGIPPGTVKSRVHYALRHLQTTMRTREEATAA
jgi:RNA polymerase sigma-70 factor (ECF subfamily)